MVKQRIRDLIGRINREEGVTIFLTSHDAGDIEKICRRAMVINHGRIVWDGTVKEMKYSLMSRRIVEVKMDGPAVIDMAGSVIASLMRQSGIQDITISLPPMEEVISHIYGRDEPIG